MIWNGKEERIGMCEENIKNEYRFNIKFQEYINRYCEKRHVAVEEALTHEIVRQVYLSYTEV